MNGRRTHEQVRALLPEVAVGVASGDERAAALEHVAACAQCRRDLDRLSETADALLLLAPERQPPAGFESRVLARLDLAPSRGPRRSTWRRALQLAFAAMIGAIAVLAPYSAVTNDEAQLGQLYQLALDQGDGVAFVVLPLVDSAGRPAGRIYAYEGRPSWVLVAVTSSESGRYVVEVETRAGRRLRLGSLSVVAGRGSLGKTLPLHLFEVASVSVIDGRQRLVAEVPPPPSLQSLLPF